MAVQFAPATANTGGSRTSAAARPAAIPLAKSAGFWIRTGAWAIDVVALSTLNVVAIGILYMTGNSYLRFVGDVTSLVLSYVSAVGGSANGGGLGSLLIELAWLVLLGPALIMLLSNWAIVTAIYTLVTLPFSLGSRADVMYAPLVPSGRPEVLPGLGPVPTDLGTSMVVVAIVFLLLTPLYYVIPWRMYGASLGQSIMNLRVETVTGGRLSFGRAFMRFLAMQTCFASPFFLGLVSVGWDRDKQGWHDKLAGTRVVRVTAPSSEPAKPARDPRPSSR